MDGHPGMAHGGTIATLFDEALALAGLMKLDRPFVTGESKVQYKAPLRTPSVVLVRSWVQKQEGRKITIWGTMEDGNGLVYATSEALYITLKASL